MDKQQQQQAPESNPKSGERLEMLNCFNNEVLEFKFLPDDINTITDQMLDTYQGLVGDKSGFTKTGLALAQKLLLNGIRLCRDQRGGFVCVICDVWIADSNACCSHFTSSHQDIESSLRHTKYSPVVGLDQIIRYCQTDGDKTTTVQHKCTLCNSFFDEVSIFWHVLTYIHKENFFLSQYSSDFLTSLTDPVRRYQKIDEALITYEKSHLDRGHFHQATFEKWMVSSAARPLNMGYIEANFPSEVKRMKAVYKNSRPLIERCEEGGVAIKVLNQHHFTQGKEILQKLNKALLEFNKL